jgi:hypothetical protein
LGSAPGATTQPAFGGSIKVRALQQTPGASAIGADPIIVELYSRGQPLDTSNARLGPDGTLNIAGLPVRFGVQAVVKITHGGVVYSMVSNAVDPEHPVQKLDVPIYEPTTQTPAWSIAMRHVIIHPINGGLDVTEMLAVDTQGDHAWIGDKDKVTLNFPLAAGASDLKVGGGLTQANVKLVDGKLISHQPLLPGEDRYQLEYTIPATSGTAVLAVTAPAKVGQMMVFIPDDGTTVTANGLQPMGSQQMDEKGPKTRYYMATSLAQGQTVNLTVAGLNAAAMGAQPASQPSAAAMNLSTATASQQASTPAATTPLDAAVMGSMTPVESVPTGSNLPKFVAAGGAAGILLIGGLVMLVKKTPVAVPLKVESKSNKGRRNARR